ncbi:MAG: cupin domain-containing protein [Candidatus Bathyarchaeia archaeon]
MIVRNVNEIKEIQAHGEALYKYFYMRKDVYHYLSMDDVLKTLGGFWQTTVTAGRKLDPHSHKDHEQIYYIAEGEGQLTVGDETRKVKKGDAVYIPPGASHSFHNDTDKACVILMVDAVLPK